MTSPPDRQVDVTVATHCGRQRKRGIRLHRSVTLLPGHRTLRNGPIRSAIPSPISARRFASSFTPNRHLVVETDGWRAHGSRLAFEADRARDVELKLAGYEVLGSRTAR